METGLGTGTGRVGDYGGLKGMERTGTGGACLAKSSVCLAG